MGNAKGIRSPGRDIYSVNFAGYLPETLKRDLKMKALAAAVTEQMLGVSGEIDNVLIYSRIDELSEELIDILAFDMHVDWYDYSYPLAAKRDILKNSVRVHKKMGTKHAVEKSLSVLYPECKVVEWFEYDGKPFTFRVCINATNNVPIRNKVELLKVIATYKRLSAHLDMIIYTVEYWIKWLIDYKNRLTIISSFFPRGNVAELFLDGEGCLDGEYCLDGFKESYPLEFYPAKLLINMDYQEKIFLTEWILFLSKILMLICTKVVIQMESCFYPRHNAPLAKLDGTQNLDGQYILSGYKDCHNFNFYLVGLKFLGAYKEQPNWLGKFCTKADVSTAIKNGLHCFTVRAETDIEVETDNQAKILGEVKEQVLTGKEQLTIEKDLWYLDGKQMLDGIVCLDADIYEVQL